jgi:hypothetical protein
MPSIKALSTYDGFSTGQIVPVTLHEARVAVQAGTGANPTPADNAADGNSKRQRGSRVGS